MNSVSLLGVPHDENSSFMRGASEGPALIRRALNCDAYSINSETAVDLGAPGQLVDHGDISFEGAADPWDRIEERVGGVMDSGGPLICLGGDHAISHPILRAVRRRNARLTILHIDAHSDIYDAYLGNRRSHASPFARIMEEGLTDRLIQVGVRTLNDHHRVQIARFDVDLVPRDRWGATGDLVLETPVYISLDMDALDPAFAPGVSHREPGGLSTRQVIELLHSIDQPIVGADLVEYNPRCDISDLTAGVAAKLLKEIAGMMVKTSRR